MKWQNVTAIYLIGSQQPVATFAKAELAEQWAEAQFPGEWIKKPVKIPNLPLAPKKAQKDLKQLASVLDDLEWTDGDDVESSDEGSDRVVIEPDERNAR